jgi:hypothetical protein
MIFSRTLAEAWRDVEKAYGQGYLVNESMMAFALYKAITDRRPDLCITYDARIDSKKNYRPDFVVWQDGNEPAVLFVCELKFKPGHYAKYHWDISKLKTINEKRVLDVTRRNPKTGEIETLKATKANEFGIGFFAIANYDTAAVTQKNVTELLTPREKSVFHFAFGSIPGNTDGCVSFKYRWCNVFSVNSRWPERAEPSGYPFESEFWTICKQEETQNGSAL